MCKENGYVTCCCPSGLRGVVNSATLFLYNHTFLNISIKHLFKTTRLQKEKVVTFGTSPGWGVSMLQKGGAWYWEVS